MRLFIPELGDTFTLTKDWSFNVIIERRNQKLLDILAPDYCSVYNWYKTTEVRPTPLDEQWMLLKNSTYVEFHNRWRYSYTRNQEEKEESAKFIADNRHNAITQKELGTYTLPVGTTLKVSRIFIRQGGKAYNSITFVAKPPNIKQFRFFARLEDVNQIEFDENTIVKVENK